MTLYRLYLGLVKKPMSYIQKSKWHESSFDALDLKLQNLYPYLRV